MKLSLITPPATLPVDVAFAKSHSRVVGAQDDALIEAYIAAATVHLDGPTGVVGRCFITQVWQIEISGWIGPVGLRVEPVQSVKVFYTAINGDELELDPAQYDLNASVGRAASLRWLGSMPQLGDAPWPVRIEVTAGKSEADHAEKLLVLILAADLFERRESTITGTIVATNPVFEALLANMRRHI